MTISAYDKSMQEGIKNLILTIQRIEFGINIDIEGQPDLLNIENFYQVNKGNFWVCKMDGQLVGTIALLDIGHKQAALRKMFVHKDYRGKAQGVSKLLLETLLQWAEEKNIKEIYLGTTEDFLAAHRFYEKNGFEKIDINQLPVAFPIMKVDSVFYKKER